MVFIDNNSDNFNKLQQYRKRVGHKKCRCGHDGHWNQNRARAGGPAVSTVTVSGCWFRRDDAGDASGPALRNDVGISINNSASNRIGGTTPAERNVICGSAGLGGIVLTNNANSNTVEGNYIGLEADGAGTTANVAGI